MSTIIRFPELRTDRLILRGPREEDFEAVLAFMSSERSAYVGGPTADRFAAWRAFLAVMGHWALRGYGFFTLEHRESGALAGRVGVVEHEMWPEPELGWQLFDGFEGQGYAFEAAVAVRSWAWREHGLGPLISMVVPENSRSVALARRLGARYERDIVLLDTPGQIFRHPDPVEVGA
ncbi:GNAT family N-acetyltransferase [Thalassococcus sp. CAU 1522]|uniref:GNAT family N-acetyltransferase n=1 Tax=Thalassococcus arenae TaxID=2851652 RepID=A0ABS6N6S7_9RHOB|nr:GNAT family N-acetyltransferase [Thalassococcus arenae]MBV2359720.1 GNAT family N-acetyltransferase [Thalassococcus arenae]